ncbi:MAG: hypothetical protein MUP04_01515, partial [Anaerolineae bacterium]|nr:hypothetical protein [Anaerolineae bacterium]
YPKFLFDETSLILLALAVLVLLLPDDIFLRLKKLKGPGFEVEFDSKIRELVSKTGEAEKAVEKTARPEIEYRGLAPEVLDKLAEAASDPRAALLLIAIDIERAARAIAESFELPEAKRPVSANLLIRALVEKGIIPAEVSGAFRDFWHIRNLVAHGQHFELSEDRLYELVELGIRVLRLLSVARKQ